MSKNELERLKNFKILTEDVKIEFIEEVDITYLNFDSLLIFNN